EIVGAIILVALVITGIGIIGVLMLSTPPPTAKEKAVLSSSCIDCDGTKFMVLINHEGGDTIQSGRLKFNLETKFQNGTAFELIEDIVSAVPVPVEF
ncbi:MAG TPA: type IV pilin, partial [Anaerolineaceae bacterium]|nr:type IV pilin [Anaerolineaceae bacterium]